MGAIAIAVLALLMVGCSDKEKMMGAFKEFDENCKSGIEATFHAGTWNRSIDLHCKDFKVDIK